MIYGYFPEQQMALPVTPVDAKLGPTELGSGPRSQFQAEIPNPKRF